MIDLKCSRNLSVRRLACCLRLPLALPVLTAVLVLTTPAVVQAQFNYTVTNQMVTITGYTGNNGVAAIPNTIDGLPVTSIGDYAFSGSSITAVTIPNSVTNIGNFAFGYCFSLTNIMVDPLNSAFSSVDGVVFNQSQTTLVEYPGGKVGGYTIPNSVTSIGDGAFSGSSLTSVTIPNGVTSLGAGAFSGCFSLTNITLGTGVTSIGDYAFEGCSGLTNVTIPNSVTSIGDYTFYFCTSLTNILVDPLNSAFSSVDGVLFNHNQTTLVEYPGGKFGGYTIPNSVTKIEAGAFVGASA